MIKIVDYGMGNLRSVQKALERLGYEAVLTQDPEKVRNAERLILPGVGAFGAAMSNLERLGLSEAIKDFACSGRPLLGICLGMQLLLTESEEQGHFVGLDLIPGRVIRFFKGKNGSSNGLKVPHMGWNTIVMTRECPIFAGLPTYDTSVYFVHSYYVVPPDDVVAATTEYGEKFCSVIWKDNIIATQFHPEKSGAIGLKMLQNFAEIDSGD